jgi:hypothetical protein
MKRGKPKTTRREPTLSATALRRAAARVAVDALRRSVQHGRPLSLPNFVRLYRRGCEHELRRTPLWLKSLYQNQTNRPTSSRI